MPRHCENILNPANFTVFVRLYFLNLSSTHLDFVIYIFMYFMYNFTPKITIKFCQIIFISPVNNAVLLHAR